MVSQVELALYELGIRLTQCRELHRRAISGRAQWPGEIGVGPADVALAQWSFHELDSALARFAEASGLDAGQRMAAKASVQACRRRWNKWSKIPVGELQDASTEGQLADDVFDNLQALSDRITDLAEKRSVGGVHGAEWFSLGREISDGDWFPPEKKLKKIKLENRRKWMTVENGAWEWRWSDPKEMRRLLEEAGVAEQDLFPVIDGSDENSKLLPYDRTEYWAWYRVEAGLQKLLAKSPLNLAQEDNSRLQQASSTIQPEPPPKPGQLLSGYLGLIFDDERCLVRRAGCDGEFDCSHSRLDWAILDALEKNRDSWLRRDRVAGIWESSGVAKRPSKGTVNDRLSDLSGRLARLKLKIRSSRMVGVRLEPVQEAQPLS